MGRDKWMLCFFLEVKLRIIFGSSIIQLKNGNGIGLERKRGSIKKKATMSKETVQRMNKIKVEFFNVENIIFD